MIEALSAGLVWVVLQAAAPSEAPPAGDSTALEAAEVIDPQARRRDLVRMAEIIGWEHHLRAACDDDEENVWRDRMQTFLELEQPTPAQHDAMIAAFNEGYYAAQERYGSCSRGARSEARRLAAEGRELSARLAETF